MSVRRLAEPAVQPATFAFNRAKAAEAKTWIRKYPKGREQSAVIPLLMLAQEQDGWVTKAAIEHVADVLGMPYIRALEVATFYTQFQLKPVGTHAHIQVCGTTPCMLRGSEALMDVCRQKIHPEQFHTNAAGTMSWEEVECAGACVNAPMVMIFKDAYEDLTPERLGEIIDAFEAGKGATIAPGPQVKRVYSAPETGLTSLKDEKAVLKSTRDREAKAAARAAKDAAAAAVVPPSGATKPKTDAPETSPALKTPSKTKASPNGEKAASSRAPRHNAAEADKAEPAVEKTVKQRSRPIPPQGAASAYKAPEMLKGEALGPDAKRQRGEKRAPRGVPTPDAPGLDRAVGPRSLQQKAGKDSGPAKPSLTDRNRPASTRKPAKGDDLKLISGVGPKNEKILHELGIYTFAQVASWKKAERAWVDAYLNFHGRIEREDWVKQAKALAKGGEAEYIRVFGKKPR